MKLATVILPLITASAFALEPITVKATATRVAGEGDTFSFRIDYDTEYEAELGVRRGHILQQRIVKFFEGGEHVGSYFYWQEVGSGLSSTTTEADLLAKPDSFSRVQITDRFYDVNWRDSRWSEEELGRWFTQTWHIFNSCNRNADGSGYYLCNIDDVPRMDGYLQGTGFTVYAVLEHTFSLSNHPELTPKSKAEQGVDPNRSSAPLLNSESSVRGSDD